MHKSKQLHFALVTLLTAGIVGVAFGRHRFLMSIVNFILTIRRWLNGTSRLPSSRRRRSAPTVTRSSTKNGPARSIALRSRIRSTRAS